MRGGKKIISSLKKMYKKKLFFSCVIKILFVSLQSKTKNKRIINN